MGVSIFFSGHRVNDIPELDAFTLQRNGEKVRLSVRMCGAEQQESTEHIRAQLHGHIKRTVCTTQHWKCDVPAARELGILGCQVCT